jgi:hypothetical protein
MGASSVLRVMSVFAVCSIAAEIAGPLAPRADTAAAASAPQKPANMFANRNKRGGQTREIDCTDTRNLHNGGLKGNGNMRCAAAPEPLRSVSGPSFDT